MGGGVIEIRLLGGFEIRRNGTVQELSSPAARSLIAFLAMNGERPLTRDFVAGAFWPDRTDADARFQLRQALWLAGNAIGTDTILRLGGTLALDRAVVELDVDEFLWSIEQAASAEETDRRIELLEQAVRGYRGELMAGHYDFDDSIREDRERLRHLFVGALDRLCDLHAAARRYDTALSLARRLVSEQPWDERAHRRVMWLAATTGRTSEALRQYEQCVQMLDQEFAAVPSYETVDLYDSILNARETGRTRTFGADRPMVGRDHERSLVAAALDAAASGSGGVVLIEGDLGIGKSRLLEAIGSDAAWRGFDVAALHGVRDQEPYGAIRDQLLGVDLGIVAEECGEPTRDRIDLLLNRRPADGRLVDDHAALQAAAAQAMVLLPKGRPLCVLIDDAHRLDAASAAVVSRLGDLVGGHPVVVVIAYRHGDARTRPAVWESIRSLDRVPGRLRLALGPFSPAQTEDLGAAILGHEVDTDAAMALHRATGGIPYLIVESLRDPDAGAETDAAADAVRHLASRFVDRRTRDLSPGALRTLRVAALGDRPIGRAVLTALEAEGVRDLVSRGLLASAGEDLAMTSDLVRSAVLGEIPASEKAGLHRDLADAIEHATPEAVDLIGRHLWEAGNPDAAAPYLVTAARQDIAVHEYERALDRLVRADEGLRAANRAGERLDALRRRLEILDLLGRRDDQRTALDLFESIAEGTDAGEALLLRARWLAQGDEFDAARRAARKALDISESDPAGRVSALASLAMIECLAGDAARGVEILDEASGFGGVGMREQADVRNALGQNLVDLQRFDEAETQLLASLALYRELDDVRGEIDVVGMLATIRMERGDTAGAAETYERALEMSRRVGYREGEARCLTNNGVALALEGRSAEALAYFDSAATTLRSLGRHSSYLTTRLNSAWTRHLIFGEDSDAATDARESISWATSIGDRRAKAQSEALLGSISARAGDWDSALDHYRASIHDAAAASDAWLEAQNAAHFARSSIDHGDHLEATSLIHQARLICEQQGLTDIEGELTLLESRIALERGDAESALASLPGHLSVAPSILANWHWLRHRICTASGDADGADEALEHAWEGALKLLNGADAQRTAQALERVPLLRDINRAWHEGRPTRVEINGVLESVGPRSHSSPETEISLQVTRQRKSDFEVSDGRQRRLKQLLRVLEEASAAGAVLSVEALVDLFGVSERTIRRDVEALRSEGHRAAVTRGSLFRL